MDITKKLELKNQALLEKVSSLTTNYENQVADLRVELTMVAESLEKAEKELANAAERLAQYEPAEPQGDENEVSEEAKAAAEVEG